MGFYQYIGDDGKIYRVEYEVGTQGFIPRVSDIGLLGLLFSQLSFLDRNIEVRKLGRK